MYAREIPAQNIKIKFIYFELLSFGTWGAKIKKKLVSQR